MAQQPVVDRSAFKQVIKLPALRVPTKACNDLMRKLRGRFTFDLPKTKCIVHDGDRQDVRLLLLSQEVDPQAFSPDLQALLQPVEGWELTSHDMTLEYQHFTADAVLRKLLPEGVEVPTSFESIGHIAHLNLRPEQLPHKALIGQVILDKNPTLRTVVNKLGSIENEYRVFDMEVIAGEQAFETEVSQHGVRFRLDFSKVYWNSRLETEHKRLVASFQPGEVVADIMAGIGPFAVPAGKHGCKVYANDLNPESAKYLASNVQLNRVGGQVMPFNMDGRQFVRLLLATPGGPVEQLPPPAAAAAAAEQAAEPQQPQQHQQQPQQQQEAGAVIQQPNQQQQQQQQQPKRKLVVEVPPAIPPGWRPPPGGLHFQHAVMNLPASAVEFLDAFRGAFCPASWAGQALPLVHVYTFMKNESEADVIARVEAALGAKLEEPPSIHTVRDVAPNKLMLCVTFRVPQAVAFAGRQLGEQQQQQQQQQQVVEQPAAAAANGATEGSPAAKKPRT
uniref:tRNA (guanine(37)-N1)-methyltransferase n=1 Tax=Tetradesmus obliquus TaxID=3088 RepID=A0A383WCY4_TETOB